MKLYDLVSHYDGDATFNVRRAVEGDTEDVITFESDDYEAVKDDILQSEVLKYNAELGKKVSVILKAAQADEPATQDPSQTPTE